MLSGISHDLRTPLTRIKLQLEFIKDKNISNKLADDVDEMEKMLNEYLQFSSESNKENTEEFEFNELIREIILKFNNYSRTIDPDDYHKFMKRRKGERNNRKFFEELLKKL